MAFQKKPSGGGSSFGQGGGGFKKKAGSGFGRKKPMGTGKGTSSNLRSGSSFGRAKNRDTEDEDDTRTSFGADAGADTDADAAADPVEAPFEETITRSSDLRRARAAEAAAQPAPEPLSPVATRDKALRILGSREHSETQLAAKLRQRGADAETVADVMAAMVENGYVSDRRFGELLVRSRAARRYGPTRIARDLSNAGLGRELIAEIMDTDDTDWRAATLHAWQTKFGGALPANPRDYAQHYRYLSGRGFTPADIRAVLKGAPADPGVAETEG